MSSPAKKAKRKSGGGFQPRNELGSIKKVKKESPSRIRNESLSIGSDKQLLLGPTPPKKKKKPLMKEYTSTQPLGNKNSAKSKFSQSHRFSNGPVYKLVTAIEDHSHQESLSDSEMNDLEVRKDRSLAVEEFELQDDLKMYDSIRLNPSQVVIGDDDAVIKDTLQNKCIRFVLNTDFTKMELYNNGNAVLDIDPSLSLGEILFTDTKAMLIFNEDITFGEQNYKIRSLLIYIGQSYTKNFKAIWKQLRTTNKLNDIGSSQMTTREFLRKLESYNYLNLCKYLGNSTSQSHSINRFMDKKFNSLNKGRLLGLRKSASRIGTPKSNDEHSTPVKSPATPKQFYAPAATGRLTRSTLKKNPDSSSPELSSIRDSIIIDDGYSSRRGRPLRENFKPSLVYTFRDKSYYKIKNMDYECLYKSQWINDTLIDFFIKYFAELAIDENRVKGDELHVFTTFFFTKLRSSDDNYGNIKRWVSKIDFSSKKYIIVPINENLHWYCSIIVDFDKVLKKDDLTSVCKIYVFDSLKQGHKNILGSFQNFLINYAKDRFDTDVDPRRIELISSAVPKQPNFNDCGVHVIYNVFIFLEDPDRCLRFWNRPNLKGVELSQFFKKKDREDMRERLRKTLKLLQSEQAPREDDSENDEPEEIQEDDTDDIVYIDADEFHDVKSKVNDSNEATEDTQDNDQTPETESNQQNGVEDKEPQSKNGQHDESDRSPKDREIRTNDTISEKEAGNTNDVNDLPNSKSDSTAPLDDSGKDKEESPATDDQNDSYQEIAKEDYNVEGDDDISRVQVSSKDHNDERFFSSEDEDENIKQVDNQPTESKDDKSDLKQDLEIGDTQEDAQKQDHHDESLIQIHSFDRSSSSSVTPEEINSTPAANPQMKVEDSQETELESSVTPLQVQASQELIDEEDVSMGSNERVEKKSQEEDEDVQMEDTTINSQNGDSRHKTNGERDQNEKRWSNLRSRASRNVEVLPKRNKDSVLDVEMIHDHDDEGEKELKSKEIKSSSPKVDGIYIDRLKTGIQDVESGHTSPDKNNRNHQREVSYVEDDANSSSLSDIEEVDMKTAETKISEDNTPRNTRHSRRLMRGKSRDTQSTLRSDTPKSGPPTNEKEVVEVTEEPNRPANRRNRSSRKYNSGSSRSDALEIEDEPEVTETPKPRGNTRGARKFAGRKKKKTRG